MRTFLASAALVPVLLVAGCSTPAPVVTRTELDGQAVVGVAAGGDRTPRGLVVYLHGADETAEAVVDGDSLVGVVDALVEDGWAVVSSDARGNNYGSPQSRQDYLDLITAAQQQYGTTDVVLLAVSMGGFDAIPLAASGDVPGLRGVVGISTAVDLFAPTSLAQDGYLGWLEDAWGEAPTPADSPSAIPAGSFAGQRFRFYISGEDEVVPSDEHVEPFVASLEGVADAEVVTCTGPHVDPSCYQPEDVVAWVDALPQ